MLQQSHHWKQKGDDIAPEFCPGAVAKYLLRREAALADEVRKHLSYLGWKIEFSNEGGIFRYRYTPPGEGDRRSYFSLLKVCQALREPMHADIVEANENKDMGHAILEATVEKEKKIENYEKFEYWKLVDDIVPEFCPEVVATYVQKPNRALVMKIRKHLSYLGWKIEFSSEGGIHRYRYSPPGEDAGRSYASLVKVCEALREPMHAEIVEVKENKDMGQPIFAANVEEKETVNSGESSKPKMVSFCGFSCNDVDYHDADGDVDDSMAEKFAYWKPVGHNIVPEFCPEVVTSYFRKRNRALIPKVRQHLSYLGWRIEFSNEAGISRYRYTSPGKDGQSYVSLLMACQEFVRPMHAEIVESNENKNMGPPVPDANVEEQKADSSGTCSKPKMFSLAGSSCSGHKNHNDDVDEDPVFVDSKYYPQAVVDWYCFDSRKNQKGGVKARQLSLKAKQHLAYMGWVFWYAFKGGKKRELRYTSPKGLVRNTLKAACKTCIDEGGGEVHARIDDGEGGELHACINDGEGGEVHACINDGEGGEVHACINDGKGGMVPQNVCVNEKKRKREDDFSNSQLQLYQYHHTRKRGRRKKTPNQEKLTREKKPQKGVNAGEEKPQEGVKATSRVLRSRKSVRQEMTPCAFSDSPRTVLSLLIDHNVVPPNAKVSYRCREIRGAILEGLITPGGIKCYCCKELFTLGGFEMHAMGSTDKKPFCSIFLNDGRSLLDCQMQLMRRLERRLHDMNINGSMIKGENDDECSFCHNGGELILCDSCPSSFHHTCLGLKDVPDGDWFCPSCCCKICSLRKRLEIQQFSSCDAFLSCFQCGHQYHIECLRSNGRLQKSHANSNWFCSSACKNVFAGLQMLVGRRIVVGVDNLTWTLLKYPGPLDSDELTESYCKLKVAAEVMGECFEPVKDARTGRDLIEDVVFSRESNLNRSNCRGFYTIVLERNDEIISVANVRVHGQKVAEVPFVATRFQYRRHGMCRVLMNELEKQLTLLGVEKVVLPAVPCVLETWTNSFGFSTLTESDRLQHLDLIFLDFHGTILCHKPLMKTPVVPLWPALLCGSNVDLDQSPNSEVLQAEETEKSMFVHQVMGCAAVAAQ